MREAVHVSRAENKTPAQLKRVLAQAVLRMAGGFGAIASGGVVFAKKMQQVGAFQLQCFVSLAFLIYQQRKCDAGFVAKRPGIRAIA